MSRVLVWDIETIPIFAGHLPEDRRARSTWRYVAQQLAEAAVGAASPADAAISLRLALMLENVECRPT